MERRAITLSRVTVEHPQAAPAPLRVVGTAFLRARPWVVAPLVALMMVTLAVARVPSRQGWVLGGGLLALFGFFVVEARRGSRRLLDERWLFASLLVTLALLTAGCVASGGLSSPLLPLLFAPTVVGYSAFGAGRRSAVILGSFAAVGVGLALLPSGRPFPPLPSPFREGLLAAALLTSGVLLFIGVSRLTHAYASASRALGQAGEEVVASARSRGEALASLGARVAHEIKNPLTAIKGLLEVMIEERAAAVAGDPAPDRQARRLSVMAGEVQRIEQTLAEYLSFSRPLGTLRRERLPVGPLVDEVLAVLDARAAGAGIQLAARGPSLVAEVDPRRLKEALLNLLLNALEATPSGGRVEVSWSAAAGEGGGLVLSVQDTGRGLDAAALARLGEPFYTTREEGTGLGVLLAHEVARLHGGTLQYQSQPGHGTVAHLRLPDRTGPGDAGDKETP
jgi:signal transduction histidine kinase